MQAVSGSVKKHIRIALLLPALVALLSYTSFKMLGLAIGADAVTSLINGLPRALSFVVALPMLSFAFAGWQYLLFMLVMYWLVGKWSDERIMLHMKLSPIYFACIMFVYNIVKGVVMDDIMGGAAFGMLSVFYITILGYIYVIIALVFIKKLNAGTPSKQV